ncbi:MAG: glycosyltransferase family 2 protein [Clostridia bacterium]|nr:glycosyltransferase family 2 protein [Clostridia bacterium]
MDSPKISLVIPVYNVEQYLIRALKSVEDQTFKNFEAIVVDDGSTDKSLEIAEKFCQKNENFFLIKQKNKGPAAARNTALDSCRGEYIGFMDSDDCLEPQYLELLYNAAVKNDADISCCNFNFYYPEKNLKIYMPFTSLPGVYSKTQALKKLILDIGMHYFVWNKLIKRALFFENDFKFDEMYFEDIAASPKLFYYANKIVILGKALYNYTSRETSILHSMNTKRISDYIKSLGVIRNFLENKKAYKDYSTQIWLYAQKLKLVSYYYIFMLHAKETNFNKFLENISSAKKSIDYFAGKLFKPTKEDELPEVPYPIISPPPKAKTKKAKNKK